MTRKMLVVVLLCLQLLVPGSGWAQGQTTPPMGPVYYHVHPGDTLSKISRIHNVAVADLARANNIQNARVIYVGQRLLIPTSQPQILITEPGVSASVAAPVRVRGVSTSFEGALSVRLLDARFQTLAEQHVMGGSMGVYAPFEATLNYNVTRAQAGYVEAYTESANDGSEIHIVTVPVTLLAAGSVPATPAPGRRVHVVRPRETLSAIARQYNITVAVLLAANPQITNPNVLFVGQRVIIP
jgi:LysM repeat protein